MKTEDFPILLMKGRLVAPIDRSLKNLEGARSRVAPTTDEIILNGLFVMTVSFMEVMLSDVLNYFLRSFPQKIPSTEFKYDKDTFFSNYFALISLSAGGFVNSLSYKSFEDYLKKFLEITSINWPDLYETHGKHIKEIKATRNLLLHNNLIVNDQYLLTAGEQQRSAQKDATLILDHKYVIKSLDAIVAFEAQLRNLLMEKYDEYTKVRANKELWSFIFKSPVMPYDDYWEHDESVDHIFALKEGKYEKQLSNSETLLLALWRAHFRGRGSEEMMRFHMRHFDRNNQEKVLFFLSIVDNFSLE